jgi:hypothetical protein
MGRIGRRPLARDCRALAQSSKSTAIGSIRVLMRVMAASTAVLDAWNSICNHSRWTRFPTAGGG